MDRREFLEAGIGAAAGAALIGSLPAWSAAHGAAELPSCDEIFGWVQDMYNFGKADRYGYRMPGTKSDKQNAEYLLAKFQKCGLKDTKLEPAPEAVAFPDAWKLTVRAGGKEEEISCHFLRYANFTTAAGVSAPMVYVGKGTSEDFARVDAKGKIVVGDVTGEGFRIPSPQSAHNWSMNFDEFNKNWPKTFFTYDPDNTLADDKNSESYPPNFGAYQGAVKAGAAGFVGILENMAGDMNQYLHWYAKYELPAVSIGPRSGARLRKMLGNGTIEGRIVLTGTKGQEDTYNIYGFIPGKNEDEIVVVQSHHDGWTVNEATGAATVLGLAKYFGQLPPKALDRTLMFFLVGSHFGTRAPWEGTAGAADRLGNDRLGNMSPEEATKLYNLKPGWDKYVGLAGQLRSKVVCANNIEMVAGQQYKRKGDDYVPTGLVAPPMFGVTGPTADEPNPVLLAIVRDAIQKNKINRANVLPQFIGEARHWGPMGFPTVQHISFNAWQFTSNDTPDTVMKEALGPMVAAFSDIIRAETAVDAAKFKPVANYLA
jgi:hypothetical protein